MVLKFEVHRENLKKIFVHGDEKIFGTLKFHQKFIFFTVNPKINHASLKLSAVGSVLKSQLTAFYTISTKFTSTLQQKKFS